MIPAPVDTPVEGYYRMRLRRGAHAVGIRIWNGPPLDPDTGEEMDRSWRWQATCNGRPIELERVWPQCMAEPISKEKHDRLAALQAWGEQRAPDSPQANPRKPIDHLTSPLPF